ncbi:MAG TPA: hypothetical protein VF546_16150 [Pyrinomonadaceae bacterium]|jgi:hypothetical protein
MATTKESIETADATRRKVFIAIGVVTALLVALMVYWATRPRPRNNEATQQQLANAVRAGAPEFAALRPKIVVDFIPDNDAYEATRPIGDIVMTMRPKVRNFTGRTLTGLELRAAVLDLNNQPLQTRTFAFPPNAEQTFSLEPNRVFEPSLVMEGFKKTDVRANIKIDVTGFTVR